MIGAISQDEDLAVPADRSLSTCECGALKVFGAGPLHQGHSSWCPWSPHAQPRDGSMGLRPWFCEQDSCVNGVGFVALTVAQTLRWLCPKCWAELTSPQAQEQFGHWWVRSWPAPPEDQ